MLDKLIELLIALALLTSANAQLEAFKVTDLGTQYIGVTSENTAYIVGCGTHCYLSREYIFSELKGGW